MRIFIKFSRHAAKGITSSSGLSYGFVGFLQKSFSRKPFGEYGQFSQGIRFCKKRTSSLSFRFLHSSKVFKKSLTVKVKCSFRHSQNSNHVGTIEPPPAPESSGERTSDDTLCNQGEHGETVRARRKLSDPPREKRVSLLINNKKIY